ncbi:MAG: type VI secretion system baseplate subunit TssG [Bryobacteraceae bacterium]
MATAGRAENSHVSQPELEQRLRKNPWSFQFFQAVRLLARLQPERAQVGAFASPTREVVRFGVHNALAFPPSQVHSLRWEDESPPLMRVNFMGLTGAMGVLPMAYTELIIERRRAKDRTIEAFFDIFNHRAISLFYRAWEKYRFPVAYERKQEDRFSGYLMHLIGLGTAGLQRRQAVPDEGLLFYSGLLSLLPRSAEALGQILSDYFDIEVEVEQFVGSWYPLAPSDQCRFGSADSYSEQVGFGAVVGDEIWDQQSRVRLRLGPLTLTQYQEFLPCGTCYEPLRALTKFFAGGEIEFEAQLILRREEVPACELGVDSGTAPQLGWLTWMNSSPAFDRNPEDTVLLLT